MTLRRVGFALVIVGALWIAPLLIVHVYVEPGNGSVGCGQVWRAERIEPFLQASCHRAIEHRRVALLYPAGLIAIGGVALVVARRRRTAGPNESMHVVPSATP